MKESVQVDLIASLSSYSHSVRYHQAVMSVLNADYVDCCVPTLDQEKVLSQDVNIL